MTRHRQGEPHYRQPIDLIKKTGIERLGLTTAWAWHDDPKRLAFTFSRYKFVAKMIAGAGQVLEVGCADAFATRIVAQEVGHVTAVDFDPEFVGDAEARSSDHWPITVKLHDVLEGPVAGPFDAAYSLDVLEHIPAELEDRFLRNMIAPVRKRGVVVIGMPSLQSQAFASQQSKAGHVNCKDQAEFKALMQRFFDNVFMFAMNDEVVHTGHPAMAHYLIALCCGKKRLESEPSED